jgi:aspartate-semialdehyde dehydrogenase
MDPDVPLVVTEINPDDLRHMPKGIASCPNCTTAVPVTAIAPLHRAAGLERMVVSTYQSVSGAGQSGLRELDEQWTKGDGRSDVLRRAGAIDGAITPGEVWDRPIAGNVIPQAGSLGELGYTSEEWKMLHESRKILHADELLVTVTCVRVPVYVGHAVSANLRFSRPMEKVEAVELLSDAPGCNSSTAVTGIPPLESAGVDPVLVGRVREDRRNRAASTSGSRATISARAPPSTQCRSRAARLGDR